MQSTTPGQILLFIVCNKSCHKFPIWRQWGKLEPRLLAIVWRRLSRLCLSLCYWIASSPSLCCDEMTQEGCSFLTCTAVSWVWNVRCPSCRFAVVTNCTAQAENRSEKIVIVNAAERFFRISQPRPCKKSCWRMFWPHRSPSPCRDVFWNWMPTTLN